MPLLTIVLAFFLAASAVPGEQNPPASSSAELRRVRIGADRLMPQVDKQVLPAYPSDAKTDGAVDTDVVVSTTGTVIHARVAKSTDVSGGLDRVCLDALRDWRFKPATADDGRRVTTLVRVRFEFSPPPASGQAGRVLATVSELPRVPPPGWESVGSMIVLGSGAPGVKSPTVIREVLPNYTADAMRARVQGAVRLELVVLPDGSVGAARVLNPLDEGLDKEALLAAGYWLFEPAQFNGQPVAVNLTLELTFSVR